MTHEEIEKWREKHPYKALPEEILKKLREKLPKQAVTKQPHKGLHSINNGYVTERLNECFGPGGWLYYTEVKETVEVKRKSDTVKMVVVLISLMIPHYGIIIPNVFGGNDNKDLGDAYKGAATDALNKACSYLNIGIDVFQGQHGKAQEQSTQEKTIDKYSFISLMGAASNEAKNEFVKIMLPGIKARLKNCKDQAQVQTLVELLQENSGGWIRKHPDFLKAVKARLGDIKTPEKADKPQAA